MNLTIDMFYGMVAAICAIIITIILYRNKQSDKLDKSINNLLTFFVLFCVIDAVWGLVNSRTFITNFWVSTIFVYLFYIFSALTTFVWFCYIFSYLGLSKKKTKVLYGIGALILIGQMVLIALNYFKLDMFEIDIVTTVYHPYEKRFYIYYLQYLYDVIILLYIIVKQASRKLDPVQKRIFKNAESYTIIFTIMTLGQMYLPNLCLFSLGLLMVSFAIAPINNEEPIIINETKKETKKEIKDKIKLAEESEIKHASIVASVSDSVKQVYLVDLDDLEYKKYNKQENKFENDDKDNNFFSLITKNLVEVISDEERQKVFEELGKDKINEALKNDNSYIINYHVKDDDALKAYSVRFMNIEDSEGKAIAYIQDEHKKIIKKVQEEPVPEEIKPVEEEKPVEESVPQEQPPVEILPLGQEDKSTDIEVPIHEPIVNKDAEFAKKIETVLNPDCKAYNIIKESEDVIDMMNNLAEYNNVKLITRHVRINNENVIFDREKLAQVLTNVLTNAIKYSDEGGKVTYVLEELTCKKENQARFKFSIKDNGVGMSEEFLKHIFEERTREENSKNVRGLGLGMYVAKNLIDKMGGEIVVNSKKGIGTSVSIYLELLLADTKEAKEEAKNLEALRGSRVLLVEKDEEANSKAKKVLEEAGILVEEAENGRTAVDKVVDSPDGYYVAILLDTEIPVFDGFMATEKIRIADAINNRYIPIIGIVPKASYEIKTRVKKAGMDDYLSRGMIETRLVIKIGEHVKMG